MSFDFTTLITDRTQSDVQRVRDVAAKIISGTASEAEIAEWNAATMKGAYNYTDLNRVTAAIEALKATLEGYGYTVPGYRRIELPRESVGNGARLPAGHTELKWIESTGTQYIDADFVPNQDTRVVAEGVWLEQSANASMFGARTAANSNIYTLTWTDSTSVFLSNYNTGGLEIAFPEGSAFVLDKNKNVTTINGSTVTSEYANFTCPVSMYLFATNGNGSVMHKGKLRLSKFKAYGAGTLIRDYVPDLTDDGQVGLYDLVEGKFYPNAGTGVFLAGPRRVQLPAGFKQVEHIESSGTQHIDTKFKPNSNTRTVLDIDNLKNGNAALFGVRDTANNNGYLLWANSATQYRCDYYLTTGGTNAMVYGDVGTVAGRYIIDKNKNVCTANGITMTNNAVTFSCTHSMLLFTLSTGGVANSSMAQMRLFSGQIYDNSTIARDYIPCVTIEGEGGLYDLITGEFYGNAGTGSFIVGPEVEWDFGASDTVLLTNLVSDGSFENIASNWNVWLAEPTDTSQAKNGAQSLKLGGDALAATQGTIPLTVGHKYYGREYIKTAGELTAADCRFEIIGGTSTGEHSFVIGWNRGDYPNWTAISNVITVDQTPASAYGLRTFTVGGSVDAWVDSIVVIDLTATFGAGNEPTQAWCDEHIPYFDGTMDFTMPPRYEWKESDIPTPERMGTYLDNVAAIRGVLDVFATTPAVPADMERLTVAEANTIERILADTNTLILNMIAAWFYCGEVYSGEV